MLKKYKIQKRNLNSYEKKGVEKMLEVLKIIMIILGIIIIIPSASDAMVVIYDFISERLYDFEIWLSLKFDK